MARAMNLLRDASTEPLSDDSHEERRLMRRVRAQSRSRRAVEMWVPAFVAGIAAATAILAMMQALTAVPSSDPIDLGGRTAEVGSAPLPAIPDSTGG